MSILGASLDDLDQLASQLHTTGMSIETVGADTTTTANAVVSQLREAGTRAVTAATDHMSALRHAVERAQGQADSANWVGQNAEVFRSAYHDFNTAMARAEEATRGYFTELNKVLGQLGSDTEQYLGQLTTSLRGAHESTESMASAVDTQRDNLDQVMNSGMRVG